MVKFKTATKQREVNTMLTVDEVNYLLLTNFSMNI